MRRGPAVIIIASVTKLPVNSTALENCIGKRKERKKKKTMSAVTMEADSGMECIIVRRYGLRPFADVVALIMIRYCARLISAAVSHVNHLFPYIITSLLIPSLAGITSSPFYLDCWHFSSVVCSVNMQSKDKKETSRSLNCLERVLQISVQYCGKVSDFLPFFFHVCLT